MSDRVQLPTMAIELTRMEQSALTMILINHLRNRESTREWFDVVHEETVTIDDLIAKITHAGIGTASAITCPRCAMTSSHPADVSNRYCGNCHEFHDLMLTLWLYGIRHGEPEPSGDFLRTLADAAVRADPVNRAILQPALFQIMGRFPKYRCTCLEDAGNYPEQKP